MGDRTDDDASRTAALALPRPGKTLTALTTSAMALPGIAGTAGTARADAPIERATASSSFSYYLEDNLSPKDFFADGTGSRERYEVFTEQLRFDFPVSERVDVGFDFLYEEMSGASPWFVVPSGTTGERLQVMSGATIEDTRIDGAIDLDFFMDGGKDTLSAGFSIENDYRSGHFGLGTERNFNDKNTVLNFGVAASFDEVEPSDADVFQNRVDQAKKKRSVDLFLGLSQILSRASTAQFTINYKHSNGFLNDPYKEVAQISSSNLSDSRPDVKNQASFLVRYRHHLQSINASVHGDYRFYVDSWDVLSHTVELAWYQSLFEMLTVTPSVRWYSQSKAKFYEPVLPNGVTPTYRTSDFRLSPYGAISARLKVDLELVDLFEYDAPRFLQILGITDAFDLILSLSYERYISDGDMGVSDVQESDEAPGLVNFQVGAFTVTGRF